MRISVVLSVYNGEAFIKNLLHSLLNQSRTIDEYVVIDDGSQDQSMTFVKDILDSNKTIFVQQNKNQGPVKSFEKGIKKATGDIVFLCDQDDIWEVHKVDRFIKAFNEGHNFVFSDARLINENGIDLNETFFDRLKVSTADRIKLMEYKSDEVLSVRNVVSGACCALRKSALDSTFFPFINEVKNMLHDRWIASLFAAINPEKVAFIPEQLIQYRLHKNQFIGFQIKENENPSDSKKIYYKNEEKLISLILDRVQNAHFRRNHYFWHMRSKAIDMPFLQRLITLNTLLLERDYKRNVNQPFRAFLSDVFKNK